MAFISKGAEKQKTTTTTSAAVEMKKEKEKESEKEKGKGKELDSTPPGAKLDSDDDRPMVIRKGEKSTVQDENDAVFLLLLLLFIFGSRYSYFDTEVFEWILAATKEARDR